jgi:nucleolar protein 15
MAKTQEKSSAPRSILKPTPAKSPRKRAADFFDEPEHEVTQASKTLNVPNSSKSKRAKVESSEAKAPKSGVQSTKEAKKGSTSAEDRKGSSKSTDKDEIAALIAGFDSSDEESDDENGEVNEDDGLALDKVPDIPDDGRPQKKNRLAGTEDGPGVIYIGRIPHGFYESQMRAYFTQFGKIKSLRLARNRKTGRSKHYAFIKFASADVADIVARTMNKYLMMGHILQVAVIPPEQVHEKLFLGAGRRVRPSNKNALRGQRLSAPADKGTWEKRIQKERERRTAKMHALKEMGYEFDSPALREVDDLEMPDAAPGTMQSAGEEAAAIAAPSDAPAAGAEAETVKTIEAQPEAANFTKKVTKKRKSKVTA